MRYWFQNQNVNRTISCTIIGLMVSVLVGCPSRDAVTDPSGDPATFFAKIAIREQAVTLALGSEYDTVRLNVAALYATGDTVATHVSFQASDSTITVDSVGMVTARFSTTQTATVIASATHRGLTRRDSVHIRVLPSAPQKLLSRIAVSLMPGKSGVIPTVDTTGAETKAQLNVAGYTATNEVISNDQILIHVRSTNSQVATVDASGLVSAKRTGVTTIVATAAANGVYSSDSIRIVVGLSQRKLIYIQSPPHFPNWRIGNDTVRLGVGGHIVWQNDSIEPINLFFDDTTNIREANYDLEWEMFGSVPTGAGHILNFRFVPTLPDFSNFIESYLSSYRARSFPYPGVYRYRVETSVGNNPSEIRGVIIVCPLDAKRCEV